MNKIVLVFLLGIGVSCFAEDFFCFGKNFLLHESESEALNALNRNDEYLFHVEVQDEKLALVNHVGNEKIGINIQKRLV